MKRTKGTEEKINKKGEEKMRGKEKGRKREKEKTKDQLESEVEKKTRDAVVYTRGTCARLWFSHRTRDIQNCRRRQQ